MLATIQKVSSRHLCTLQFMADLFGKFCPVLNMKSCLFNQWYSSRALFHTYMHCRKNTHIHVHVYLVCDLQFLASTV